jgi:ubiquitin carboxyl-terminal hydrolase 22/27/51
LLGPQSQYEYELYAVVNHEGQLDTGHYTNFARYQDEVCSVRLDILVIYH